MKGCGPSFVTIEGATLKKPEAVASVAELPLPPDPVLPPLGQTYGIVVTGVGGTGIVTVGAILGMAAHLEGKGASVMDLTGLAGSIYFAQGVTLTSEQPVPLQAKGGGLADHVFLRRADSQWLDHL